MANEPHNSYLDHIQECFILLNNDGVILELNNKFEPFFSISVSNALGDIIWDILPEVASHFYRPVKQVMKLAQSKNVSGYYAVLDKRLEINIYPEKTGVSLFIRDTTKEHMLKEQVNLLDAAIQNSADSVVITNKTGKILSFNKASENLFGYSVDEAVGQNIVLLMGGAHAVHHADYMDRYIKTQESGIIGVGPRELIALDKTGKKINIELAISEFNSSDEVYFVASMRDITERKELHRQLENIAGKDPLTGLPNRQLLIDRATQAVAFAKRNKFRLAVVVIDLDGFKEVNDSHGHSAGDWVLKTLAERVSSQIRESDTLSRIGGDEFVILLPSNSSDDDLKSLIEDVLNIINEEIIYKDIKLTVGGSIGVSCFPKNGNNFEQLFNQADEAMYQSKKTGKNKVTIYSESM